MRAFARLLQLKDAGRQVQDVVMRLSYDFARTLQAEVSAKSALERFPPAQCARMNLSTKPSATD